MGSGQTDDQLESFGTDIGKRTGSLRRVQEWFLVEGNRVVIAVGISTLVFLLFLGLNEVGVIAFVNDDSITRLAGGMIAGTFSLVTLVVSINQLILSQEFASASDARDELEGVLKFQSDIAEDAGVVSAPSAPARLLEVLVHAINDDAQRFEDAVSTRELEDGDVIERYTNTIADRTERTDETLEQSSFGTVETVSAAIGYNSPWHLSVARHIRGLHGDSLSDDAGAALDDLIESLRLFNVAREHFKTTYLQRELTRFSQLTIYAGVPSILSAMIIGFIYAGFGGASVSVTYLPFLISGLIAVVVFPLSLLVAYILRTATIARRTASVGPMIPQKQPGEGPFDVATGEEVEQH